ncbi:exodeoxyribonuclease III [Persicobacter psychrovividus]|uniref:Exodeoxyribonuclease n=1 Tax=Persicobacter psychrovividus TaxID=387638 RepID=A0ABM7VHJ1_9BACT|nr:exodeoxyribonuclease [Persicobacter psychrovividus]
MKIISYNINGIRAAIKKGFNDWLADELPDVLCLQEVKAEQEQVDTTPWSALGYEVYWMSAQKKGYSGVAILTKVTPKHVEYGCGIEKYDNEGRVIRVDFEHCSVINTYMPSGSSGDLRQAFKMEWLADFQQYTDELKKTLPHLIICGDYNICHTSIDIHNPEKNKKTSGFLPEEREWVTKFIESGFVDSFRAFQPEPHHYSWWSYRAASRERNKGWRIDYLMVATPLKDRMKDGKILPEVKHSDHCPVYLEIE